MRTAIQTLSLLLFTALFLLADYRLPDWLPADLYLRLDPLLGLQAVLASREVIPRVLASLILVGATLAFGRFFCAYLCPLGASLDGLDFLLYRRRRRPALRNERALRRWKYLLLILILGAALAGVSAAYLFDPISLLTRIYTFVLYPLGLALLNLLLDGIRPLSRFLGWTGLAHLRLPEPVYDMALLTLGIAVAVAALSRLAPRFWCRFLCPLGALLSLLSPLGVFRRRVGEACNRCMACRRRCPMGAIGEEPLETLAPECIQCRECARVCPQKAVSFPRAWAGMGEYSRPDISRRGFVASLGGGIAFGALSIRTPFTLLQGKRQLIRPPGAIPETEFLRTCVRCGECMKSCVTNTLQPAFWESGSLGLWTPRLELRLAACEPNCNACGKVCPTQAIRSLPLEEKTHARIGTAVLRRETCLVWAQNRQCLICDEICPYNAIVFRTVDGLRRPFVVASRCNGCGYCEQRCPVAGESAIVVVSDGEIRLKQGSYVAEAKKLELEFKPDPGDDRFEPEEAGTPPAGAPPAGKRAPPAPKGFLSDARFRDPVSGSRDPEAAC